MRSAGPSRTTWPTPTTVSTSARITPAVGSSRPRRADEASSERRSLIAQRTSGASSTRRARRTACEPAAAANISPQRSLSSLDNQRARAPRDHARAARTAPRDVSRPGCKQRRIPSTKITPNQRSNTQPASPDRSLRSRIEELPPAHPCARSHIKPRPAARQPARTSSSKCANSTSNETRIMLSKRTESRSLTEPLYRIFSAATQTEPQQATEGDHRIRN